MKADWQRWPKEPAIMVPLGFIGKDESRLKIRVLPITEDDPPKGGTWCVACNPDEYGWKYTFVHVMPGDRKVVVDCICEEKVAEVFHCYQFIKISCKRHVYYECGPSAGVSGMHVRYHKGVETTNVSI